jgi:murein DD-endopeptidase MepM/ murein hydrolase activator NlpD
MFPLDPAPGAHLAALCGGSGDKTRLILATVGFSFVAWAGLNSDSQGAVSPQQKLDRAEARIEKGKDRQGVLTTEIDSISGQISSLEIQVSGLRQEEAAAESDLANKEAELETAISELQRSVRELKVQRRHLNRALISLRRNLVAIYVSGSPDLTSLVLASSDYGGLIASSSYLEAIQNEAEDFAERVRILRDQAQDSVERNRSAKETIERARDEIALRERELELTRTSLEGRQASLASARSDKVALLGGIEVGIEKQEGIAEELKSQIQGTIAEASSTSGTASPSGTKTGTGSMIWPIDGTLTSPFGPRWGTTHEGLDISAPGGTPIKAADSGTVILIQSESESGGYGNFTCVDHGGGLSTCYAHQSEFGTSVGAAVSQGDVIGYVGNTGNSFGDHLHFEVRVDGVAQDPLEYL